MVSFKTMCSSCGGNCYGCFYADRCPKWLDEYPYEPFFVVPDEISVALCESRHEIPQAVNGSIFPQDIPDPMDFTALAKMCEEYLGIVLKMGVKTCNIYVTGLTPALITAINCCRDHGVKCVTHHFDRATGEYIPLPIK